MIVALLTAAGIGSRSGLAVPKQFYHVQDKPIIVYTLEAFQNHPSIDEIVCVTLKNWIDVLEDYKEKYNITKLKFITAGGKTGQESINKGLKVIKDNYDNPVVMIHDGNRCNVSSEIISNSIAVYKKHGSAVAAIPCVEAMLYSNDSGVSSIKSIPRENLFRTQTPHTFTLEKLLWAHEEAKTRGIKNTAASCTLMQELGETVYFSQGSEMNLKITTPDDIELFKMFVKSKKENDEI